MVATPGEPKFQNVGGSPPEWGGGAPGIVFSENFRWLPPEWGVAKFSEIWWLLPRMGGSLRDSFWCLRGSPGGVFKVATPHLREADRNPYWSMMHIYVTRSFVHLR